jgi:putative phosphoribosyl transferase
MGCGIARTIASSGVDDDGDMVESLRTFRDRREAGGILARDLAAYRDDPNVLVLGLARGGLPVACEVAAFLRAPVDVCLVRKLGVPQWPELAMGAVGAGGAVVLNEDLLHSLDLTDDDVHVVLERETVELRRREHLYRGGHAPLSPTGRTVLLVDDGIATGASIVAAARTVRAAGAARVVLAAPIAPQAVYPLLRREGDDVVLSTMPVEFGAVGQVYADFHQVSDDEVRELLAQRPDDSENG